MMPIEYQKDIFSISTDKKKLDIKLIHSFLSTSYWAKDIPLEIVQSAIDNSECFGLYSGHEQIGFARVVTDYSTFGYLADVFVLENYRGKGLAKWLMECVMLHPELQGFRRWMLLTRDAHGLYAGAGFTPVKNAERYMEISHPYIYVKIQP